MSIHNLPTQPTTFVGRTHDLTTIAVLLADPACRLLTLVGPGGIGKTRLALEAAAQLEAYPEGIHFVALQPLTAPEHIISAIASAVGFQFYSGGEPKQQLLNFLSKKHLLLLLDNFEHLLDGADFVSDILAAAPGVQIIVTSRERLNLTSETIYNVSGMHVPDAGTADNPLDYSAVQLFVQSARRVRPNFAVENSIAHVINICRLVGGMPLAILLAAAWVEMLSLEEIAVEIERGLELLETEMRDLPERHRSVRATFDYSWGRLSENERDVFKKLSVFRGGFTREAAKEVTGASLRTLVGLVNKSFVQTVGDGRYDLHELLRQYGEQRLNDSVPEFEQARERHATYYGELLDHIYISRAGSHSKAAVRAVGVDYKNIRTGWDWAVQHAHWDELWKFAHGLQEYANFLNHYEDALTAFSQAVTKLEESGAASDEEELLATLLTLQVYISLEESITDQEAYRKVLKIMSLLNPSRPETLISLYRLGFAAAQNGDLPTGERLIRRSVALIRAEDNPFKLSIALGYLMIIFINAGINLSEIKVLSEEVLNLLQPFPASHEMASAQGLQGYILKQEGNYAEARPLFEETCRVMYEYGSTRMETYCQCMLGEMAYNEGDYTESLVQYTRTLASYARSKNPANLQGAFLGIIKTLTAQEKERAVELSIVASHIPSALDPGDPALNVAPLLEQLEAELPLNVFAAAVERGKALDLDATIQELLAELSQPEPPPVTQSLTDPLTRRELEILNRVADGRSNREIAAELFLSPGTVKWYLTEIYGKLAVNGRVQAIARARELNLLT